MSLIEMERYTLQQRIKIVKIYYKNGENFAEFHRKIIMSLSIRNV